jgi:hypothetical protein
MHPQRHQDNTRTWCVRLEAHICVCVFVHRPAGPAFRSHVVPPRATCSTHDWWSDTMWV